MARDPAHIGRAPEDLAGAIVEDQFVGIAGPGHIAAGGVQHALGLSRRARGIEDEHRILRAHRLWRAVGGHGFARRGVGDIAPLNHGHVRARAGNDQNGGDVRAGFQGLIDIGLQRHLAAAAQALVGGNDHMAVAVLNPARDGIRREAAEHHRMDRANPGAGQHGIGRLRDHRHIDGDTVALLDPPALEDIGHAAGLFIGLAIGDLAAL